MMIPLKMTAPNHLPVIPRLTTSKQLTRNPNGQCELDGIAALFDERSGSDLSAYDESHGDDNRELARSESNSENDNTELSFRDFERADENNEATATAAPDDSKCELDGNSSLFDERIGSDLSATMNPAVMMIGNQLEANSTVNYVRAIPRVLMTIPKQLPRNPNCQTILFANLMAPCHYLMNTGGLNWVTMVCAVISMQGIKGNLLGLALSIRWSVNII